MNDRIVLTDDLLRQALLRRMAHEPGPALLERIVDQAAAAPQERAPRTWLPWRAGVAADGVPAARAWLSVPALTAVAAIVIATVLIAVALRPVIDVPGASPSPTPSRAPAIPSAPLFSPEPVLLGEFEALRLRLDLAEPIDVAFADGSIWTANIRGDDVRRFDPATMEQLADVQLAGGAGPAWFTVADDDLWVAHQLGSGLSRIDPATNTVVAHVGAGPTCMAPVQAFESIFQSVCDGGTFLRIDPVSNEVVATFPAEGHGFLVVVDDRLITQAEPDAPTPDALAELDPDDGSFTALPFSIEGFRALLGADGDTLWVMTLDGVKRIDPDDGAVVATFPFTDAQAVSFVDGRAWLTATTRGALEIDLERNEILRRVPVPAGLTVAREVDGVLWVTSFGTSHLWRVEL